MVFLSERTAEMSQLRLKIDDRESNTCLKETKSKSGKLIIKTMIKITSN